MTVGKESAPNASAPPDVVLLGAERLTRALLRAQLIEDGFEVIATDTFQAMRPHLRPGAKPRLAIVDLQALPDPEQVLDDLGVLMPPGQVIVLGAIGTVPADDIARRGFVVVRRPVAIDAIVEIARGARARTTSGSRTERR
jgi:hypothetical protein